MGVFSLLACLTCLSMTCRIFRPLTDYRLAAFLYADNVAVLGETEGDFLDIIALVLQMGIKYKPYEEKNSAL